MDDQSTMSLGHARHAHPEDASLAPMHGFGIARRVSSFPRRVKVVNAGSLLVALQRLERAGLLDAEWGETENGRRGRVLLLSAPAGNNERRDLGLGPARRCHQSAAPHGVVMRLLRQVWRGVASLFAPARATRT